MRRAGPSAAAMPLPLPVALPVAPIALPMPWAATASVRASRRRSRAVGAMVMAAAVCAAVSAAFLLWTWVRRAPPVQSQPNAKAPVRIPPTTPPTTSFPPPPTNEEHDLPAKLRRLGFPPAARFLVFQTDDRLSRVWTDGVSASSLGSFKESVVGPSVLAMSTWARRNGHAYVFADSSSPSPEATECTDARGNVLYPTWCKVPRILQALALARAARAEFVVVADTDVGPMPRSTKSLEHIASCLSPSVHVAFMSADWQPWDAIAHDSYPSGTVNTGIILLRVSDEADAFVRRWWFDLPLERTPTEKLKDHASLRPANAVLAALSSDLDALVNDVFTPLAKELRSKFNVSDPAVQAGIVFRFSVPPGATRERQAFEWCCGTPHQPGACTSALATAARKADPSIDITAEDILCEIDEGNSMTQWPGDQDRANLLVEEESTGPQGNGRAVILVPGVCNATSQRVEAEPDPVLHASRIAPSVRKRLASLVEGEKKFQYEHFGLQDFARQELISRFAWRFVTPTFSCFPERFTCMDGSTIGAMYQRANSVFLHWTGAAEKAKLIQAEREVGELAARFGASTAAFDATQGWEALRTGVAAVRFPPAFVKEADAGYARVTLGGFDVVGPVS